VDFSVAVGFSNPPGVTAAERRRFRRLKRDTHPLWWHTLHRLWTRNVGKRGYDKREWANLEVQIKKAIKDSENYGPL
jgi:hypothetical protein